MKNLMAAASLATLVGCGQGPEIQSGLPQTGLELNFDILSDTDIASVLVTITQVDCDTGLPTAGGHTASVTTDYEDMLIPGANPALAGQPYDGGSGHIFADQFFTTPPGCYDVLVQPLQEDGTRSRDCASAHYSNVEVFAGSTTEIHLIMQCRGEGPGGLDVIASINHPPSLDNLAFDPSKFTCEETVTVCASASDPDNDPIYFEWTIPSGSGALISQSTTSEDGTTTSCATFELNGPGDYTGQVTVYDMGYDADGNLVTIEELLALQGDPSASQVGLSFPIHVLSPEDCLTSCECEPPFMPTPAGDGCVLSDTVPAVSSGEFIDICEGDEIGSYGWMGAAYPGGTFEPNSYWGDSSAVNGRLVDVGIWGCEGVASGTRLPVMEWIGFTVCLDIAEAGDYIVGTAADNEMRFFVDGVLVYSATGSVTANFNAWWLNSISLTSGLHIITVEGRNLGSNAAFGAEVSGPFAAGSLNSDAAMQAADYDGNLVFSTQDMVGQQFQTGESSGWQCPDGYSVNTCSDEPVCSLLEYRDCE